MGRNRKSYSENFKRNVAIEAIREKKTVAEIAAEYNISPSMVTEWKNRLIEGKDSKEKERVEKELKKKNEELSLMAEELGRTKLEVELLKKKTSRKNKA